MEFKTRLYAASTAALENKSLYNKAYTAVSQSRREKTDKFIFMKDRRLSLGAELLLMRGLSDLGLSMSEIIYGDNGKPYFRDNSLFFNISHSEERVICAFSPCEVGCDVEKIKDISMDIAERFFFASEYDTIMSDADSTDAFFRFWTLKESFMKATGKGMSLELDSFEILLGDNISVRQNFDNKTYRFREYNLNDSYKYAVCALSDSFEENARLINFNELL